MDSNQRFDQLKAKYGSVLDFLSGQGGQLQMMNVQDGKLLIRAAVPSEEARDRIDERLRQLDPGFTEVLPDIRIEAKDNVPNTGQTQVQTSQDFSKSGHRYQVKAGDSLDEIAREVYGDAGESRRILEANKDQMSGPEDLRAGQILNIPALQ